MLFSGRVWGKEEGGHQPAIGFKHLPDCILLQLIDWRNTEVYLGFREPVVVHANPATVFPPQDCGDKETYTK